MSVAKEILRHLDNSYEIRKFDFELKDTQQGLFAIVSNKGQGNRVLRISLSKEKAKILLDDTRRIEPITVTKVY